MVEGELFKWTNYLNGWQTRWFCLRDGVLSYYNSVNEIHAGCRGSFKVSALEITVSTLDPKKFVLTTPGGLTLHLRTKYEEERQLWLMALCSCQNYSSGGGDAKPPTPTLAENSLANELHMYYDILVQQVLLMKAAVIHETNPDIEKLEEGSMYLNETCHRFLKTIDQCINLSISGASSSTTIREKKDNNLQVGILLKHFRIPH